MGDFSMEEVQAIMVSLNGVLQEVLRPQGFTELGDVDPTKNSVSFDARRDNGILVTWRLVLPEESRNKINRPPKEPRDAVGNMGLSGNLKIIPKEQGDG